MRKFQAGPSGENKQGFRTQKSSLFRDSEEHTPPWNILFPCTRPHGSPFTLLLALDSRYQTHLIRKVVPAIIKWPRNAVWRYGHSYQVIASP